VTISADSEDEAVDQAAAQIGGAGAYRIYPHLFQRMKTFACPGMPALLYSVGVCDADYMPGTPATANLPAGTATPSPGIYVVKHGDPAHSRPHAVRIASLMILPECTLCADVRFSLRENLIEAIEDNQFFQYLGRPAS
jgi:hypothetical protein